MSTKVEQASRVESGVQTNVTPTSSAASTSTPKISKFAAKSGFVIPKNKLSGSLVPIFRGGKKLGGTDLASEEIAKEVQRKTKWGPDLTLDPAVRKGRALAYQTRVDQITQQLKLGILETGDNQDSPLTSQISDRESSGHQINSEKSELLELERREAIGEILKLNPSYKAPVDYKPLLKEAKVPIPIKEYPGYNFIGLIFGSASDTQKRLEKETGAKIRVYGTKPDTGEKDEITLSDGNENQCVYEELYVNVCADTYEKVDAAVALIELLVTPVSVNPVPVSTTSTLVSGDNANVIHPSQGMPTPYTLPSALINQGVARPIIGSSQAPLQGQFQPYPNPWFPMGPPSGFNTPQNSSAPILTNPIQVSSSPLNTSNMPSLFGPRPVPQNPAFVPSRPQPLLQAMQRPYMPQPPTLGYTGQPKNPPMPSLHSTTGQPNISAPPPFTCNPTGPNSQVMRPLLSSMPPFTGNQPTPMARPMVPPRGPHHPMDSRPNVMSGGPPFNMVSPITVPFQPSPSQSFPTSAAPLPAPTRAHSSMTPMLPNPSPNTVLGAAQILSPIGSTSTRPPPPPQLGIPSSVSGSVPSFTPVKPPSVTAPKPQHPSSNDFTFQPHRPQNPPSPVMPRPGSQPAPPNVGPQKLMMHPPQTPPNVGPQNLMMHPPQTPPNVAPQNLTVQPPQTLPSFRPALHNSAPPPVMQVFHRPQVSNQMSQPRAQISMASAGNSTVPQMGPRNCSPAPQMGPRNFSPGPQALNTSIPFPPRPGNPVQLQQNYPAMGTRPPHSFVAPNQQFNSNQAPFPSGKPSSGAQQIYDPFSPTSVPQLGGGSNPAKVGKQETDPEYEDLMASVGVK